MDKKIRSGIKKTGDGKYKVTPDTVRAGEYEVKSKNAFEKAKEGKGFTKYSNLAKAIYYSKRGLGNNVASSILSADRMTGHKIKKGAAVLAVTALVAKKIASLNKMKRSYTEQLKQASIHRKGIIKRIIDKITITLRKLKLRLIGKGSQINSRSMMIRR